MKELKLLIFLLVSSSILISCGSDEDDDPSGFECTSVAAINSQLENELNALNAATEAYTNDPGNSAKCTAWKNAYFDYIDALEGFENCYIELGQQTTFQQSIDAAQAAIASIPC